MSRAHARHTRWGLAITVTCLAIVTAGCAATGGGDPGGTTSGSPVRGGTLTVGMQIASKSLDPLYGDAPDVDRSTYNLFYEPLVRALPGGKISPVLAESYQVSADATVYTFKLRSGVTFHDGTAFNADAVVYNLRRATDPASTSPRKGDLAIIKSVEAADAQTVKITLKAASGSFLAILGSEAGMMVSPAAAGKATDALQRHPVGTGPFAFDSFRNSQDVVAKRNPAYWRSADGEKLPYLDQVVFRVIPDVNVKLTELKTGGAQLIDTIPVREAAGIEKDDSLRLIDGRGVQKWMAFNVTRAPFDDVRVRQAISYAIDREAISKAITNGRGKVNATLCTETEVCYDPSLRPAATDMAKAKSLLAEAGKSNLTIRLSVINREPDATIAQLAQAQLKDVGVTVNIQTLERQKWIESVRAKDFDMATLQIGVPRLDPELAFGGSFATGASQNWAGADDAGMFAAVAKATTATTPDERRQAYSEAQKIILDKAYYVFFYWNTDPAGASKKLQGITGDQAGAWDLGAAYLTK